MLGVRFVSRASHIKRLAEKKALSHDLNHVRKPLSLLPIHPNHVWKLLKPMGVMITLCQGDLGVWGCTACKSSYRLGNTSGTAPSTSTSTSSNLQLRRTMGVWGLAPKIKKIYMSFPPAFLAGLDGQRAK